MDYPKLAKNRGASYAEILRTKITSSTIEVNNREVKEFSAGQNSTYAVRLLYKGSWGLAYSGKPEYPELIAKAIKNAKTLKQDIKIKESQPVMELLDAKYEENPAEVDMEDKKDMLLSLDKRGKYKRIKTLNLTYSDKQSERYLENTEGSSVTMNDCRIGLFSTAYARQGARTENFIGILRKRAGYELMREAEKTVDESMQKAEKMLTAKLPKGGLFPAVVDQYIAGVFAHEAIGHACEADLVLNGSSILAGKTGRQIGNPLVTIYDDGSKDEWGHTPVDSEGAKAHHTILINRGVLQNYLHNRETARIFKAELTGNGRSQDPTMRVIPRMTNTIISEGDSSFEEMLQAVKSGYYLKGSSGGQVDPAGGDFLFNAREGYLIENHKIKHMVKGVSLLGSILETLNNIRLIAKDTECDTGYCGKAGQAVPVACGAPHILIHDAKIGGAR